MCGDLLGARLRPHAIRLHVLAQADARNRVGVWVIIGKMRALIRVRLQKQNLRADLDGRAQRLSEGIGGLDRHVDGSVVFPALLGVKNHRHLRKARQRTPIGVFKERRQLDRDHLRALFQKQAPQCHRKFHASRRYREVEIAAALQASELDLSFEGHSAGPLRRASA